MHVHAHAHDTTGEEEGLGGWRGRDRKMGTRIWEFEARCEENGMQEELHLNCSERVRQSNGRGWRSKEEEEEGEGQGERWWLHVDMDMDMDMDTRLSDTKRTS